MTLSTLFIVGITGALVIFKLALFAVIVALAAKTITSGHKLPTPRAALSHSPVGRLANKR